MLNEPLLAFLALSLYHTPDSRFVQVSQWQYFARGSLSHYLSKATLLVNVLEQYNDQNISLITSKYKIYASGVYFHTK